MVALATVLSVIKIVEMPYGGSVTVASMLPIVIIAYRTGTAWGLGSGLVYAVIQQLLGLKSLSYFTTWQSILAIILLDYIIAFTVVGLGGVLRRIVKRQSYAICLGALGVSILRYICHVISGATVWAGLSIPDSAALIYSFGYNATYMLPEAVILIATAFYVGDCIDFRKNIPERIKRSNDCFGLLISISGLPLLIALITAVANIAPTLQIMDGENDGMFTLANLGEANWLLIGIVAVICVLVSAAVFVFALVSRKRHASIK